MKTGKQILILALLLAGCSRPSGPSAQIRFREDGAVMTNRYSLITQVEVIRSHMILGKTVNSIGLAAKWGTDCKGAIERLQDSLDISTDVDQGIITISLRKIPESERAEIINSLCEQIPKDDQILHDPTPPQYPRDFDRMKYPQGLPLSINTRTNHIQAELVRKAQ